MTRTQIEKCRRSAPSLSRRRRVEHRRAQSSSCPSLSSKEGPRLVHADRVYRCRPSLLACLRRRGHRRCSCPRLHRGVVCSRRRRHRVEPSRRRVERRRAPSSLRLWFASCLRAFLLVASAASFRGSTT